MPRTPVLALLLALAIATPERAGSTPAPAPGTETWREALRELARELPARHPAPFLHVTRAHWDSAATSLDRRLPAMSRNQAMVAFMQLVAQIGDAHTAVEPGPSLGLRFYPLELYAFDDGVFVRRASPAHADLAGARVLRIGRVTAEQALARVATVIPHENDEWVRALGPFQLMIPEVLDGLGLADDVERLPLVVERDGRIDTATIVPAGRFSDQHAHGAGPIDTADWTSMRSAAAPWWEQHPAEVFWWTFDPPSRTLYACLRAVQPAPGSSTNRPQWDEVFALSDSVRPSRLVIDVRENTGGNGVLNRYPVQQILRRPALDRPDRLFVVIGRRTFSAGQQFTNLLEAWTHATLVGEPTGQSPSQYGDHRPLPLPGVGLTVQVSSVFHQAPNEFDVRTFVPPRLYAPLDSRSYRLGIDPALVAVLSPDTSSDVVLAIERAIAAGDSAAAGRVLDSALGRTVNRYRAFEGDVNALGYRFAALGRTPQAIQVFRLNTRAFPRSANAFDSLGETLLGAGDHDAAVEAYRKALELQPGFPSSAQALQKLGVTR